MVACFQVASLKRVAGSGASNGFSSPRNMLSLLPSFFWNGFALYFLSFSRIAWFNSYKEKNWSLRSAAVIQVDMFPTVPSAIPKVCITAYQDYLLYAASFSQHISLPSSASSGILLRHFLIYRYWDFQKISLQQDAWPVLNLYYRLMWSPHMRLFCQRLLPIHLTVLT